MKKRLLIGIILLIFAQAALCADVRPTEERLWEIRAYSWTLAANQGQTGDSERAVNVQYCAGPKTLEIKASGEAVDITVDVKEDDNAALVKTILISEAGTYRYSADHHIGKVKTTSTIAEGQIDSIKLRCN
jgi:hypothetical protein